MSAALVLQGVTKRYQWRGPWVLNGADLSIEPGSLTSIVGSNGSGKSTLLRIAAGVTSASSGIAVVPGRVGFVPERQAARGKFSGTDYLTHMGRIRGLHSTEAATMGIELMRRLGVRPGPGVAWDQLSKGNRQKVVLAQAFLGRLDVVVLDEPFSGLDEDAERTLVDLISEVRMDGTSVLVSSHHVPTDVSQTYRIVDGRLKSETLESKTGVQQRQRVELVRRQKEASTAALTDRAEVLSWHIASEGSALVLEADPVDSDGLIRAALDQGWSVCSVIPMGMKDRD